MERARDIASGGGLYLGATADLALGLGRFLGEVWDTSSPGIDWSKAIKMFELGNLVPSWVNTLLSGMEATGADMGGILPAIRAAFHSPFREHAIELKKADLIARRVIDGPNDPRAEELATQEYAQDDVVNQLVSATRTRSPERLGRQEQTNIELAIKLGPDWTVEDVKEARLTGHPEIATLLSDPKFALELSRKVGEAEHQQARNASTALRAPEYADHQQERQKRAKELEAIDEVFAKQFREIFLDSIIGTSPGAPIDVYQDYQRQRGDVYKRFEASLPTDAEMREMAASYGSDPIAPSHLRIALNGLQGDPYTDKDGNEIRLTPDAFRSFAGGFIDWASYFDARDAFINALSPEIRSELERYKLLVDEDSIVPNLDQFRKGTELQRELQDLPRYFMYHLDGTTLNLMPIDDDDQRKVQRLHRYVLINSGRADVRNRFATLSNLEGFRIGDMSQEAEIYKQLGEMIQGQPAVIGNPDADPPVESREAIPPRFPPEFGTVREAMRIYDLLAGAMVGDKEATRIRGEIGYGPRARVARRVEMEAEFKWQVVDPETGRRGDSPHGLLEVIYDGVDPLAPSLELITGPPEKPILIGKWTGETTAEGRKIYENNQGGVSSELTIGVTNPQINGGQLTHIPSIYNGRIVGQAAAERIIIENDGRDPETGRLIGPRGDPGARSDSLSGEAPEPAISRQ